MRRPAVLLAALVLAATGLLAGIAVSADAPQSFGTNCVTATAFVPASTLGLDQQPIYTIPERTATNENCVTYSVPTETVTTTVQPPPPPPPPPTLCDAELSPGGNVATFEASLLPGQTGCLHGGTYTGHWSLTRSGTVGSLITLQSYPGEQATFSIGSAGDGVSLPGTDYLRLKGLSFRNGSGNGNTLLFPNGNADNVQIIDNEFGPTNGQAVFADATTDHLIVDGNYCHDIGADPTRQTHCFYIEGDDNRVSNNLCTNVTTGFCVQMYPVCHRGVIANNTSNGAFQGGIIVGRESGTCDSVDVVNNIVVGAPGQPFVQCYKNPTNVRVHHNLYFSAAATNCPGASNNVSANPLFTNGFHLGDGSPGIDSGDLAWLFSPDLDGVTRPQGAGVDKGAYER